MAVQMNAKPARRAPPPVTTLLNAEQPKIVTEMRLVTPALAVELLARNVGNRRLRPFRLKYFMGLMRSGRWEPHHQGIALDENGNLLDGQHRLMAIRDTGCAVWMNVSSGVPRRAFLYIDTHATRSIEDATGIGGSVVAVANCLLRVCLGNHPPRHMQLATTTAFRTECEELTAACSTVRRGLSSAPVRAAAVATAVATGDSTYPYFMYRALVCRTFDEQTPAVQALYRQLSDNDRDLKRGYDEQGMLFARAVAAFDQRNSALTKIQIKDLKRYREFAAGVLKKKGVSISGAKSEAA
jgi:hypothetical protein